MYVKYSDASPSIPMNVRAVRKLPLCDDLVWYIGFRKTLYQCFCNLSVYTNPWGMVTALRPIHESLHISYIVFPSYTSRFPLVYMSSCEFYENECLYDIKGYLCIIEKKHVGAIGSSWFQNFCPLYRWVKRPFNSSSNKQECTKKQTSQIKYTNDIESFRVIYSQNLFVFHRLVLTLCKIEIIGLLFIWVHYPLSCKTSNFQFEKNLHFSVSWKAWGVLVDSDGHLMSILKTWDHSWLTTLIEKRCELKKYVL